MTMAALSMTISPDFTMNIETLRVGMKAERSVYPPWRALLRLTHTFNILFKNKDDQFRSGAVDSPSG
jgi:hypothetical protein